MERWNVLIADDERIIREGIRESIDWSSIQLEVIGEAADGEEALDIALEQNVHILLVDINMPIMDGLTLIKNIREKLPKCRVIIITGHDEFSYAQQAIRLHVDDYITKPIDPEHLLALLLKLRKKLEEEELQNSHQQIVSRQVTKNVNLLREQFCSDWIEGRVTEEEVKEQLQFLDLPPLQPNVLGVIRWPEMDTNQHLVNETDSDVIMFAIDNIVTEWFKDYKHVICQKESGLFLVLLWGDISEVVVSEVEILIQKYLKIIVYQHFEWLDENCLVGDVFDKCKDEVLAGTEKSQLVRRAEIYIYENYQNSELSLEKMAESLHVSSVYLSRMMKQELGLSFVNYLTRVRISRAIDLLNSTDYTINEISEMVGYDTQHYFSTAFKKMMDVSPLQYRKGKAFT